MNAPKLVVQAPKIDLDFVKTFAQAALQTLKVQCSYEAKPSKSYVKGTQPEIDIAIAGVIGLTSSSFSGSIAIGFPKATYLKIMGGMLGDTFTEITPDLADGASELINIIFGCAKKTLNDNGHNISRAVPSVVQGDKIKLVHMSTSPIVVIPFESKDGAFVIEIVLE
jgi:chemotaxis protein CheX